MASAQSTIRIAIHIEVEPGGAGGTAQSTQGLVSSLGKLDGPERYLLVVGTAAQADWVRQYRGANQEIVSRGGRSRSLSGPPAPGASQSQGGGAGLKRVLGPGVQIVRRCASRLIPQIPQVPLSDGYYEGLGCDVLHFPTQPFILCALPMVYNPHDLQHLHYPQFWTAEELLRRETVYRAGCHFANTVVVGSEWIKHDVVDQYHVHPRKVQIIPWAPPTAHYPVIEAAQLDEARQRLGLPESYVFYPAMTWAHKNHVRLFEAMAELRERRGLVVQLVCTGAKLEPEWSKIERRIRELRLESQVKFLGYVSELDLRAVYRQAQFLILPSLFEADSCPIYEAWAEGVPVASSNHTALPEQVGDAALLFDAQEVGQIAGAVEKLATDAEERRRLIERGNLRVKDFSWERTAAAFRAVYRRAARVTLNEEDRWLLSWDWMKQPGLTRPQA